ncbi:hypothetical protein [Rubrivirga marina]|uniref:hypothetical protein n=1 Tax=Rubrivirga marina TaxID=1196024 RepID=UPI0015CBF5D1|nr:hypothetical protein [Rubrivirga marina]
MKDATVGWFGEPARRKVFRRLEHGPGGWDGPGAVSVTDEHLIFEGHRRRTTSLRTIRGVERYEAVVWIQRRNAHDWLVRCQADAEAKALVAALRPSGEAS